MLVLVCGANGMLGARVVREAEARGHDVRGTDLPELDLTDAAAVEGFVRDAAPDVVVNCAAYTDVDAAETDEERATRINSGAAANLAQAAPYLVHVSTDYVFAGDATEPYTESATPDPRTAYGRSKLAGERAVQAAGEQHAIVRTAWLYGAGGGNFVDTILRLGAERDELKVVDDQVGSPTWTGHLAPALLDIAERREAGVLHATGDGQCTWFDLAREALAAAGAETSVVPCTISATSPMEIPAWAVSCARPASAATDGSSGVVRHL
jgi:dTDP-4-dehydrorhamnose reductase